MSIHDETADILFHAAMALGSSRVSSVRSAIVDAMKYLTWTNDVKIWRPYHEAYRIYQLVNNHSGDAWIMMRGSHGGVWIPRERKTEQLMSMLFAYEYVVQELGAARSPQDLDYS
jgi:hypothetical protein